MSGLATYTSIQDQDPDTLVNRHAPLVKRIEAKEFSLIALLVNMDQATTPSDRFSERMIRAIKDNYSVVDYVPGRRGFYLHRPRLSRQSSVPVSPEVPAESKQP